LIRAPGDRLRQKVSRTYLDGTATLQRRQTIRTGPRATVSLAALLVTVLAVMGLFVWLGYALY